MNRFNRWIWIIAGIAVLGASLTIMTEGRAMAQAVRAALVRNQDEPGRNPYSEQQFCTTVNCSLTFAAVPPGQRLVLTSVNFAMAGATPVSTAVVLRGHLDHARVIPGTPLGTALIGNAPVMAYFEAGEQPVLTCATAPCGNTLLQSILSGYFISLP